MKKILFNSLLFYFIFFGISSIHSQEINQKHKDHVKNAYGIEYPETIPNMNNIHKRSNNYEIDSYKIPVYGFEGDSFILYDIYDPCGNHELGLPCRCRIDYPLRVRGPRRQIEFAIEEPMDILITNILPETGIFGNEIYLYGPEGEVLPSVDCYYYHDYEKINKLETKCDLYLSGLQSFMAYKLLPGHYSVYVNGVKASNAGTGYGKIATMIIGTLKEDFSIIPLLESGLINPKIPLQPGFDYNLPLNLGIHDKDFTNAEISRFNESYLGFYTPSGPLYYYDQYESSWESWIERLENYKKIIFQIKEETLYINSDSIT